MNISVAETVTINIFLTNDTLIKIKKSKVEINNKNAEARSPLKNIS